MQIHRSFASLRMTEWIYATNLRDTTPGGQNEEDSLDPSLAVTRRVGDCTNNPPTNKKPCNQPPKRHPARPQEKSHRRRRSDARRQIQLQTQPRPGDIRPPRRPHDRSE